ncbi:MAG: Aminopeptidase N [Firmicutes bacterium]|nr:Aminopeptidase N [Bacillota bacterium]
MRRITVVIMLAVLLLTSCNTGWWEADRNAEPIFDKERINQYTINCYYDEVEKIIKGYQQITYYNNEESILEDIYIHLYPNYFNDKDSVPFTASEMYMAYPDGFDIGFINIDSLSVEGDGGTWGYTNSTGRVLRVELSKPLKPGEHIVLDMNYTVKLPRCNGRFGYGQRTVKGANWYPVVAVFDVNGWNLDPYYSFGDPFYSDVSNYSVNITIPESYEVAAAGVVVRSKKNGKGFKEISIVANRVRDFAWIASEDFKIKEKKVGDVKVKSYFFQDEGGEKALEVGAKSIEIFSSLFGEYPYKNYSVVAADFYVGGMEYPNLVIINKELYNKEGHFSLEYVVAHETAHQWWYGVIGNNEVMEPWLDEGLTEYSTILYYENRYGKETAEGVLDNIIGKRYKKYSGDKGSWEQSIHRSLAEFDSAEEYYTLVYYGGAVVIHQIREALGDQDFFNALKTYYKVYSFENATTNDFLGVVENTAGMEIQDRVNEWLSQGI